MASVTCRGELHMRSAPAGSVQPGLNIPLKGPQTTVTELADFSKLTTGESIEKCLSPTESAILSAPSSPKMEMETETPRVKRATTRSPDSSTHSGPQTASRPTSAANSIHHHSRSNSRSTARSRPPSRHSSLHSSQRAVANPSIVPVPSSRSTPADKRESLLALHRESCRLFQEQEPPSKYSTDEPRPALYRAPSTIYKTRRDARTSSEIGNSAPSSPISSSPSTRRFDPEYPNRGSVSSTTAPHFLQARDRSHTMPGSGASHSYSHAHTHTHTHAHSPSASSIHVPATVMEWTSPSTRRLEYEKIDRASRGVRGLWRRVAPRWCQKRDSRTPFFEEGKTGREGSVRRFRMDLPDESEEPKRQGQAFDLGGKGGNERRAGRSKTSP
ncbi:uncharacterized protein N7482_010359 [Penicillium canariense]|uniref:Uncharacterized protein n=1 Tax=Penicillium canariense TaxID=189055 RepID=A0A9W9HMT9_9EURO|nr:uncharacterized protein N7482_010359 [Penicillium canariense]KAJ5151107.1 hypothetical protein N7482_010359 [Penicillium canariense]